VPIGTDVLEDQKSVPLYTEIRAWNFDNVWSFLRHQSLFDYANVNYYEIDADTDHFITSSPFCAVKLSRSLFLEFDCSVPWRLLALASFLGAFSVLNYTIRCWCLRLSTLSLWLHYRVQTGCLCLYDVTMSLCGLYHRLRGSASPVVTATHHSYGSPKLSDFFPAHRWRSDRPTDFDVKWHKRHVFTQRCAFCSKNRNFPYPLISRAPKRSKFRQILDLENFSSLDLAFDVKGPERENTHYSSSEPNESDIVNRQSGGEKLKYALKFYLGGTHHVISRMRIDIHHCVNEQMMF